MLFHLSFVLISLICCASSQTHVAGNGWDYYCVGNCGKDAVTTPTGGTILMGGGTDVDDAFKWLIKNSNKGDILIIRTDGTDAYNSYVYAFGNVNTVSTLIITMHNVTAYDPFVLAKLQDCEGLFFAGGDQHAYYSFWKDTPLNYVFNDLINTKGITVGGTSAGMMIHADFPYVAEFDGIESEDALVDPYDERVTLGFDFLKHKYLQNTVLDSHFVERDRMGRLITFLARLLEDNYAVYARGIAVDQETALLIDTNGVATVVTQPNNQPNSSVSDNKRSHKNNDSNGTDTPYNRVYLLDIATPPQDCQPSDPLTFSNVRVQWATKGDTVDFKQWKSSNGNVYYVSANDGDLSAQGNQGEIY